MTWFLNLSTRNKLFVCFGLIGLAMIAVIAIAFQGINAIQQSQQQLYREEFADALALKDLRNNQNAMRSDLLQMIFSATAQEREKWHKEIKERTAYSSELMNALLMRNDDDSLFLTRLQEFKGIREEFVKTRDTEIIPLIYAGNTGQARELAFGVQHVRNEKMRQLANALVEKAEKRAEASVLRSEQIARTDEVIFVLVGLSSLAFGFGILLFLSRITTRPLEHVSLIAGRIAAGDLAVDVPQQARRDEIGMMLQAFQEMVVSLRKANQEIKEGIQILASAAQEITAVSEQTSASTTETATALEETATTAEEVKQTVFVSNQKSKQVSESALKALQASESGKRSVEKSIEVMNQMKEEVESVALSIVDLSEQSRAIGEIMDAVNELAEQSNLLAVNAAIEAAKAGEQGKGFAVVSQEVRRMAEQSKQATARVGRILRDVQKAVENTVLAAERGSKAVEAGVEQAREAGQVIGELASGINESAQAMTQIAASGRQQLAGMDQVVLAMQNIREATSQNVAGAKQVQMTAGNLREIGFKLKEIVEKYKS